MCTNKRSRLITDNAARWAKMQAQVKELQDKYEPKKDPPKPAAGAK